MIRISQIKLPYYKEKDEHGILKNKIEKLLKVKRDDITNFSIVRKSVDGRYRPDIYFVYTVDVELKNEDRINRSLIKGNISKLTPSVYDYKPAVSPEDAGNIVVVGMGPAGLFCGYFLAINGYKPIIIERGKSIEERKKDVQNFWEFGQLNPESNVQFGEGGAGTFSDGKLNTMVKDKSGRNKLVLDTFVKFGAHEEIAYVAKPHIGTDVLEKIVVNMRKAIEEAGGQILFSTKLTDIHIKDGKVCSITVNDSKQINADKLILALGHSARDTFKMLKDNGIRMEQKAFAVGVRMEHPQELIDNAMYGMNHEDSIEGILGAADYKLTASASNGRAVYSFCMCPGGYVVNASSEDEMTAVNGMSYSKRDSKNANSAIIVSVTPDDFESDDPLAGVKFQRKLERAAYIEGNGKIPVQLFGDFKDGKVSKGFGHITPVTKGDTSFGDINKILPKELCDALKECIPSFGRTISGFDRDDAILLGVESRTSSPLRIERNEKLVCNVEGIYPCGEGAGYAGGITSAAMDGIRVFEAVTSS
ncbi:MAG: FAD-dependent oxidoreductase [Lachnospiraceae bacterium]|nr:FAD-dependent oxidoreductase [Lachnospiraceae bacterium]